MKWTQLWKNKMWKRLKWRIVHTMFIRYKRIQSQLTKNIFLQFPKGCAVFFFKLLLYARNIEYTVIIQLKGVREEEGNKWSWIRRNKEKNPNSSLKKNNNAEKNVQSSRHLPQQHGKTPHHWEQHTAVSFPSFLLTKMFNLVQKDIF